MASTEKWYPNLAVGDFKVKVSDCIRLIFDSLYSLSGKSGTSSIGNNMSVSGTITAQNSNTPTDSELITKKYADAQYGSLSINKSLSASGSNPLNLSGLTGYPNCSFQFGLESLRPSTGSYEGQVYYAKDTKKIFVWDSSSWTHILNTL